MQYEKEKWNKILNVLEKEVTAVSFDLWIKTLEPLTTKDDLLILVASSQTAKNQCLRNHANSLTLAIRDVFDGLNGFEILNPDEKKEYLEKKQESTIIEETPFYKPLCNFNKKYTFDSFVVGNSNQFVYAASKSVSENPSSKFNPLFVYGGVGLGKTHLLHAIGNHLKHAQPNLKVLYVTCEQFTNDYIDTLSNKKEKSLVTFRDKYRNLDVLMIDDIQFITNKIETQEQFFHTFNDLYQNNKQVIIASDRHPRDIATLSDRLKSRFAMGLIQDIQKPDFETRLAILKKKAQEERYSVEEDVFTFLAETLNTNIREIEGALQKTYFYANLMGKQTATMVEARESLKEIFETERQAVTPENILEKVCRYFNVTREDVIGKSKKKEIVEPRQVAVFIITELLDLPLASIGKIFNGRDHTTIIHSRDKIGEKIKTDNRLKIAVEDIKNMVLKK